jgi:hypothetical protein
MFDLDNSWAVLTADGEPAIHSAWKGKKGITKKAESDLCEFHSKQFYCKNMKRLNKLLTSDRSDATTL